MKSYRLIALTFGILIAASTMARAQEPAPEPGVEVLTRGPVHEAYANAVTTEPAPGLLAPRQPPAPIEELPPDQKPEGDNVQWMPGYWQWDDDKQDFLWVSGFWRVPPPNRTWVPGTWRQADGGQWQWTGGFWNAAAQAEIQYLPQPPAEPNIAPPPQPGPDYVYAPGCWVYHDTRYLWRPGFWYAYRPGWVYVPAHYSWTPYGYVFVDAYWDYPLRRRGVLFAPVYFSAVVYSRPAYVYTPRYVVYDDALYGALFVRPGGGYYFGDYFEARYTSLGYRSWFSVSIGGGGGYHDPLFAYYRHSYGPNWAVQINNVYVERTRYPDRRPPRTLVQQNVIVNNITRNTTVINNNTTVVNNVKNVSVVAPITKVDKSVVNLTKITPAQQQQAAQGARQIQQVAVQRAKLESQPAPVMAGRPNAAAAPRTLKLDLPKPPQPAAAAAPGRGINPQPLQPNRPATPAITAPNRPGAPPISPTLPPGAPGKADHAPTPIAPRSLPGQTTAPPLPARPGLPPANGLPPAPGKAPPPNGPATGKAPPPPPPGQRPLPPQHQPPQHQPPPGQHPQPGDKPNDRPPSNVARRPLPPAPPGRQPPPNQNKDKRKDRPDHQT